MWLFNKKQIKFIANYKNAIIIVGIAIQLIVSFFLVSLLVTKLLESFKFKILGTVIFIILMMIAVFFLIEFVLKKMDKVISHDITIDNESAKNKLYAYLIEDKTGEVIEVKKTGFTVGRMKESVDYVIKMRSVGKIHAKIFFEEGKFYLVDLGSKNGTYINGRKLNGNLRYELVSENEVSFANEMFEFKIYNEIK